MMPTVPVLNFPVAYGTMFSAMFVTKSDNFSAEPVVPTGQEPRLPSTANRIKEL